MNNTNGFTVNNSIIEIVKSDYATIGDACLHSIHPPNNYAFESVFVNKYSELPSADNGYQVTFDIYYPTTNNYNLTVRFFATLSSYVEVIVNGSNDIQSITITNNDFYKLELFTRTNAMQTEYWLSNIRINLI